MNPLLAMFQRMVCGPGSYLDHRQKSRPDKHVLLPLMMLTLLAGCDSLGYKVVPVSGVVTLNGKPLDGALINTQPISDGSNPNPGPGSFAKTDTAGGFSLELVSPIRPGAVVGTHRVRISKLVVKYAKGREDAPIVMRNPLPRNASDGSLQLSVPPEGLTDAQLDLVAK